VRVKLIAIGVGGVLAFVGVGCSDDPDSLPLVPASGGTAAGTGGTGGTGGEGVVAMPVYPTVDGTTYSLQIGNVTFSVNGSVGGRVTTFAIGGANVLTGPDVNPDNYGSTFWPAPQALWNWPPPSPIDKDPYAGQIVDDEIVLLGGHDPITGISVEKRFSADSSGWVTMAFTMTNTSNVPQSCAPWQVTRVIKAGFSFFPTGPGGVRPITGATSVGTETWFDAASSVSSEKLYADGMAGWLAHVVGNVLFVKRFVDLPVGAEAQDQAEIEIYSGDGYVELEILGPLATLNVGDSVTWTVQWKLLLLPEAVPTTLDGLQTASLVATAEQTAAE